MTKQDNMLATQLLSQSTSLESDQSSHKVPGHGDSESASLTRGCTGPQTELGKERSKHNALRHGIFSKVAVLKGESQAEFDALQKGLRGDCKPEGTLEELLVDKLAVLIWRFRRFLIAERAEIQVQTPEFARWEENERNRQQAATFPQLTCNGGLIRWIENPEALQGCVNLLQDLKRAISANGFDSEYDRSILNKLYGRTDDNSLNNEIYKSYLAWQDTSLCEEQERKENGYASPDQCKENFLDEVKEEIRRLERYRKERMTISARKLDVEAQRLPDMDRLQRYETTISREIDRTLNQLERLQRMRLGQPVPPPINLNVTSTKE